MTRRSIADLPSEDEEQETIMQWAALIPIVRDFIYHSPNGGLRNKNVGAKMKRLGVRKGVSDLHIPYPVAPYLGLWIELKRADKNIKPTEEQDTWLSRMRSVGHAAFLCHGATEAIDKITKYMSGKLDNVVSHTGVLGSASWGGKEQLSDYTCVSSSRVGDKIKGKYKVL